MGLFGAGKKRILVADDEMAIRLFMTEALGDDYGIIEAQSGPEAVDAAVREVPDLILLDIDMPGMTGLNVLKTLRANEKTRGIPVVMCTGRGTLDVIEILLAAGANDYVVKPISLANLRAKIAKFL